MPGQGPAANGADAGQTTRSLPSHLRYLPLSAELPPEEKWRPSALAAQLKGHAKLPPPTTRPRVIGLLNMADFTQHVDSVVPLDEPLFQPSPPEVVFDSFEPFKKYTTLLRMRNNDNVNRRIKILKPESTIFSIEAPSSGSTKAGAGKVAPGMEIVFKVHFSPRALQDYTCELICMSEREKFVVAVSARGPRACFEFPDGVDFGTQPVRADATEAFLLRNSGAKDGRFALIVDPPFSVTPSDGWLAAGEAMQLMFSFKPENLGDYHSELEIEYDSGERCYAHLSGAAADVDVQLERSLLQLDPCYISLLSQRTLKLYNRSDVKVTFEWKAYASAGDERRVRMERAMQLEEDGAPDVATLRALRRAIEEDQLMFEDPVFAVAPMRGEIFPGGFIDLTVTFKPQSAGEKGVTAYCELTGRECRLPLHLLGRAYGPRATWLYDTLDVGDVYVNSLHRYEVVLENHGEIEAEYSVDENDSMFASKFAFTPTEGTLLAKHQVAVEVNFCSDLLGEFNETFVWKLKGQPAPLPLTLKGRVVGPTFHFSLEEIAFGTVSLGFLNTKSFHLHNTSDIPLRFSLRVPEDNNPLYKEFAIVPANGVVLPRGKQRLQLEMVSFSVRKYEIALHVDVEAVGDDLLSIPITGECIVPKLVPSQPSIDFGDSFLGHKYTKTIDICNTSELPAKFEVVAEDEILQTIGLYEATPDRGIIEAKSSLTLRVDFTADRLGPMSLPMYVKIKGMPTNAFTVDILANSMGPNVILDPSRLEWGSIPVLTDVARSLRLTNRSLVKAEWKAVLRKADSAFSLKSSEGVLDPDEEFELKAIANLDDIVKTTNEMIISIKNSPEIIVPMSAIGTGVTILPTRSMRAIEFGEHFSNRPCSLEFSLENKGRKAQQLTWINTAGAKKRDKEGKEIERGPLCFSITPDKVLMEPGAACNFTVRGFSASEGLLQELFHCMSQIGNQKRNKPIFETLVSADFISPLVESSVPVVRFEYMYEETDEIPLQHQAVILKNTTSLPLTLQLRATVPFSVDASELSLGPLASGTINVSFNPAYPGDRECARHESRLLMSYREHPQKDGLKLLGESFFPNLKLDLEKGDFGSVFNDAARSLPLTISNPSRVAAHYSWSFTVDNVKVGGKEVTADGVPVLPFDVLPIRGTLPPGGSDTVELYYKGGINSKARAVALCEVAGGPSYELPLVAESATVSYRLDKNSLDFGLVQYDRVEEKEMYLQNTGRVPLAFQMINTMLSRSNVVEVVPSSGRVNAGEKQKLLVRVLPGLPEVIREVFQLQVAHFEPEEVVVHVEGTYPRVQLNLPQEDTAERQELLARAAEMIEQERRKVELPEEESDGNEFDGLGLLEELRRQASAGKMADFFRAFDKDGDTAISKADFSKHVSSLIGARATQTAIEYVFKYFDPVESGSISMRAFQQSMKPGGSHAPSSAPSPLPPPTRPSTVRDGRDSVEPGASGAKFKAQSVASEAAGRYRPMDDDEISKEAERLGMRSMAAELINRHAQALQEKIDRPETTEVDKTSRRVGSGRRPTSYLDPLPPPPHTFFVAKYVLDFGNVVKGASKKRTFKLKNVGNSPVSLQVDKHALATAGFRIEPDKVLRLPGIPDPEIVDFTVTFQSKTFKVGMGPLAHVIRLDQKPGPPVAIVLKANVTVPDLRLSESIVEFKDVLCGRSCTMTVLLHNPKEVLADWSIKKPIEDAKDFAFFSCNPSSGMLSPGGQVPIEITFTPVAERFFSCSLVFKVSNNNKAHSLQVTGQGRELKLHVSPDKMALQPVLPYASDASAEFTLINPTDYPIEVYSVDFDEQYLVEERIMRESDCFVGDVVLLPPRNAGDPMWESLMSAHQEKMDAELEHDAERNEAEAKAEVEVGELDQPEGQPATPRFFFVLGAPLSGVGTQAKMVAKTFDVPIVNVGDVLRAAAVARKEAAAAALADAPAEAKVEPKLDPKLGTKKELNKSVSKKDFGQKTLAKIPMDAMPKVETPEPKTEEEIALAAFHQPLEEDRLRQCIASVLSPEAAPLGAVIELPEQPVPWADYLQIVDTALASLPENCLKWAIGLELAEANLLERAEAEHQLKLDADPSPGPAPDLDEAEYEMLTEADRIAFEASRREHRRLVVAWEARRKALHEAKEARCGILLTALDTFDQVKDDILTKVVPPLLLEEDESADFEEGGEPLPPPDQRLPGAHKIDAGFADPQAVTDAILEILPEPEVEPEPEPEPSVPPPRTTQIVRRPRPRPALIPPKGFQIVSVPSLPLESGEEAAGEEEASAQELIPVKGAGVPQDAVNDGDDGDAPPLESNTSTRWVLPPRSVKQLMVRYSSTEVGRLVQPLRFEIMGVGSDRQTLLTCSASCVQPSISKDYRNVFHRKLKSRDPLKVKKAFVISRNTFEFGPLLVNRPKPVAAERTEGSDAHPETSKPHPDHAETFHITNHGPFPLDVYFSFLADGAGVHRRLPAPGVGSEDALADELPTRTPDAGPVFFLSHSKLTLQPEETQDLTVSAFPDMGGLFEETLLCTVTDNPQPVLFPLSAIGSIPALVTDTTEITFERMLLWRADTRVLTISSRAALPIRWWIRAEDVAILAGDGKGPGEEDFTITPTSGLLSPGASATLSITFHARELAELARSFRVDVSDQAEPSVLGVVETHEIALTAEAYKVDVNVEWPNPVVEGSDTGYNGLDFGSFKVIEEQKTSLEVVNLGKYTIGYKFVLRKPPTRDILTLSPSEGTLDPAASGPGSRQKIEAVLHPTSEVSLKDNLDVRLLFTELLTGEVIQERTMPIKISAHGVFSRYSVVPRGINFGPMQYDVQKERSFELSNTGEFDFKFTLRGKGKGGKDANAFDLSSLVLGNFTITPSTGTVDAGGSITIVVKFNSGKVASTFHTKLIIDVADRDPKVEPEGMVYELIGESCIPGIQTTDFINIFEEQSVHRTINISMAGLPRNVFSEEDALFCFGSHMVGQEVSERFKLTNPFKVPCSVNLSVAPRTAKVVAPTKGSADKNAVDAAGSGELPFEVEPKKCQIPPHEHRYVTVYCTPQAMRPYYGVFEAKVELGTDPKTNSLSFDLLAEGTLPHVTVVQPTARTEQGAPILQFPRLLAGRTAMVPLVLRNEGVLPATVNVTQVLDLISSNSSPNPFSSLACGQSITIESMAEQSIEVCFKPSVADAFDAKIKLAVLKNSFEDICVCLKATSYAQQVAFEDLPPKRGSETGDEVEEINFGDVEVGVAKSLIFSMRNFSNVVRRFEWPQREGVSFSPSVGHILPGSVKSITATFKSDEPLRLDADIVDVKVTPIAQSGNSLVEWDNSMTEVKYLTEEEFQAREARIAAEKAAAEQAAAEAAALAAAEAAAAATKGKGKGKGAPPPPPPEPVPPPAPPPAPEEPTTTDEASISGSPTRARRKVIDVEPEPDFEVIAPEEGTADEPPLKLSLNATCDYSAFECETTSVVFRPTMMFQTRSHSFPIKNTGVVMLHYMLAVRNVDGGPEPLPPKDAPFNVHPKTGTIAPGETSNITVQFSPTEVDSFVRSLEITSSNPTPGASAPRIMLSARSERPYCHMEIVESDYLTAGRRSPDMPGPDGSLGPLDPAIKCIEFASLGTKVRNTKRFFMINPTNRTYEFVWEPDSDPGAEVLTNQPFKCQTRKGMIMAGRKFEMIFHFTPEEVKDQESFWHFRIPELQIEVPFLLVGTIKEPDVALDRMRHNFGPLQIGQRARETIFLQNSEHLPFSFSFDRSSFAAGPEGTASVVDVEPSTGVVGPGASLPIELSFAPTLEKHFNFNMELRVKNKPQPLVLNVKGEGYAIQDSIQLQDSSGKLVEISPHTRTLVDFGEVHVNDKVVRQLQVTNSGRYNFEASLTLKLPQGARTPPITIIPEHATVKKNDRVTFQIIYNPTSDAPLPSNLSVTASITNGRSYQLQLLGRGRKPKLSFSFQSYDFGPCFIVTPKSAMPPKTVVLQLANEDVNEIYFDMPTDSSSFLSVSVDRTTLMPGEQALVTIVFTPREAEQYKTLVPFLINGLWHQSVDVLGEGCELRLELQNPQQQQLQLGSLQIHQQASRTVNLVNRSRCPVDISASDAATALRRKSVHLTLGGGGVEGVLRPRETRSLELRFSPTSRIPPFSEPIVLMVCGQPRPMLVVSGACVAMALELEMDQVAFGQATLNSRITRRLMLQNLGDMPSTFRIDSDRLAPDFSVSPTEGYLQANEDTNLEITFHPSRVNRDIRYERIPIFVDGQQPLPLTLTGVCVAAEPQGTPLVFKARVREKQVQSVQIKNPGATPWRIAPAVQNDQWSGAETLEVPAGATASYAVTFNPMTMTAEGQKHEGTLFFPLPDGTAVLYKLEGVSERPQEAGVVSESVTCKQQRVLPLKVTNWLKIPQRFKVEIRAPEKEESTQLKGHDNVDVPAGLSRDYMLSFYAYKEGVTNAEVHFINEKTGEYLFYKLQLKAQAAGVLETIELQAPLRQLTSRAISLSNPLDIPVTFSATVNNAEVSTPPNLVLQPKARSEFVVEWRPLLVGDKKSQLTLTSAELGTFLYDLKLQVLPAGETKTLHFKEALGGSQTLRFRFHNFLRRAETYKVALKGGSGEFEAESQVSAPAAESSAGQEVSVDVTFEPSKMGESTDMLVVTSAEGGEYSCQLLGQALPPKPQGPITIKAGAVTPVNFKNVFASAAEFTFVCEPTVFTVAKPKENVPPKKAIQVGVGFKPDGASTPVNGKLTVNGPNGFKQVFYLCSS
ncbi:hypothetical protein AB1Y20_012509 [Prymnesium parvum]|uniref:EF-hand domain-containing protein n=1 Tax=Prymnesium parvum TaxID=97485 RepID=A0AB34II28_PRYPA